MNRLIKGFFGLLLLLVAGQALADYPAVLTYVYNGRSVYFEDPAVACTCADATYNSTKTACTPTAGRSWTLDGSTPPLCLLNGGAQKLSPGIKPTCPFGGSLVSSTSNGTVVWNCRGADMPNPCADTKEYIRKFYYTNGGPYTMPDHYGSCVVVPNKLLVCRTDTTGTYCMWSFNRTGNLYQGSDKPGSGAQPEGSADDVKTDPQTNSPPIRNPASKPDICATCIPCPNGSVQAGIDADGVPLCVGSGTNPVDPPKTPTTTTKPPTTTTGSDGTVTTIQDTVQQNSDGSTTTTTTTTVTKPDGTKTVSVNAVTGNNTAGQPGKTDTPSADQANLCKQNPNLTICRNSTVSGTCAETTCVGDAIQCATLRAAAALQCQQKKDADDLKASPLNTLGTAAAAGNDPAASTLPTASKAEVVTLASIEGSQGWLGAGSYFKDKTVQLPGGKQLVIPLSQGQDVMIALRYVTMIVCSLVCLSIIRSTFTSSGV